MKSLMMMSLTTKKKTLMRQVEKENESTHGFSCRKASVTWAKHSSLSHLLVVNTALRNLHMLMLKPFSTTKTIILTWKLTDQFKKLNLMSKTIIPDNGSIS